MKTLSQASITFQIAAYFNHVNDCNVAASPCKLLAEHHHTSQETPLLVSAPTSENLVGLLPTALPNYSHANFPLATQWYDFQASLSFSRLDISCG
jgi:hypothetical protein